MYMHEQGQPRILDSIDNTGDVINFYNDSVAQLGNAVYGEPYAKDVAIASIVSRKPLILSGIPGFGKSTLSEVMPSLVAGTTDREVALISGQHDLTGNQLIGGEIGSTKKYTDLKTNEERQEYVGTLIDGIIQQYTRFVRLEEANGTNPYAIRTLLPVLENHRIENSSGELEMPDLLSVVATMNPTESGQSTFDISDAMASRFALGAVMGVLGSEEEYIKWDQGVRAIIRKREAQADGELRPQDMVAATATMTGLSALRGYVRGTGIDGKTDGKISQISFKLNNKFDELHIPKDGRIGQQVESNAKTLGGLRNENHCVGEADLRDASRAVLLGRLGALVRTDHLPIEEIVNSVV